MYLSKISIKNFRVFSDAVEVSFSKGLNLLVGENGSGKSTAVDAIRALLGENEFSRRGIIEEDFFFYVLRIPEEIFRKSFYLRRILKFDGGTESRVLVLVGRRL